MKRLINLEKLLEKWIKDHPFSIAIWSIIATIIVCCTIGALVFFANITQIENMPDLSKTGPLGDTFNGLLGPFIAFLVAILTFLAFYIQYKANEIQYKANKKQDDNTRILQFEDKFFELIQLHRANVNELKLTKYHEGDYKPAENREVFKEIFDEFIECYREVKKFSNSLDPDDYLMPNYKAKLHTIKTNPNTKIEMAIIDIAYSIVFYGIDIEGETILRQKFQQRYNNVYFFRLLAYIKLKPLRENQLLFERWETIRKMNLAELIALVEQIYINRMKSRIPENISQLAQDILRSGNFNKYYGGHQQRLGHYYRHLFQSYKFLNKVNFLNPEEKYSYGKTLRAQLSTYEQALLMINSISSIGWKWEFAPDIGETINLQEHERNELLRNAKLITKYQLIKNLPGTHIFGIKYRKYYPNVKFESEDNT